MTVAELIEKLKEVDGDRLVVMSCDEEGNGYSPFCEISTGAYIARSTWSGDVGIEALTDELANQGFDEEDVAEDGVPALVLWPTS